MANTHACRVSGQYYFARIQGVVILRVNIGVYLTFYCFVGYAAYPASRVFLSGKFFGMYKVICISGILRSWLVLCPREKQGCLTTQLR